MPPSGFVVNPKGCMSYLRGHLKMPLLELLPLPLTPSLQLVITAPGKDFCIARLKTQQQTAMSRVRVINQNRRVILLPHSNGLRCGRHLGQTETGLSHNVLIYILFSDLLKRTSNRTFTRPPALRRIAARTPRDSAKRTLFLVGHHSSRQGPCIFRPKRAQRIVMSRIRVMNLNTRVSSLY